MNFVSEMNDNPDSVHPETVESVKQADLLLERPFSFYGFDISLGIEDQIDVNEDNLKIAQSKNLE